MDIKILDSHLREHLVTKAKPKDIARVLSLTSASIEKIEQFKKDYLYHIEITTNRVDMASVTGIAREAAAMLPQFGFDAHVISRSKTTKQSLSTIRTSDKQTITIQNNDKLVKRICAVVMEVAQKESPQYIKDRLEATGIRSLNNLIDITNYVMLDIGHPTHVFDFDRLSTKKLVIREAKKGEKITTLDKKEHTLLGGDIVADNGNGGIVDLLGIMGTFNSVVTKDTKRVLLFIDNNDPAQIRKTSMSLDIRTEAAAINEKSVDPELAMTALLRGVELYQQIADAIIISEIIDIYPQKWHPKTITVSEKKINQVIGIDIPLKESANMLERLGFKVKQKSNTLVVSIPSFRDADMNIAEDVVEEISRMYGYHNLPSKLPPVGQITANQYTDKFFWENRAKNALKYWGFTEIYTYSMVSKKLLSGLIEQAVAIKNPLDEDHIYMRTSIIPSLLEVVNENRRREELKIFEIANVYNKKPHNLPDEVRTLTGMVKGENENFFTLKGIIEQLAKDLGVKDLDYRTSNAADIFINKQHLGKIAELSNNLFAFELNFDLLTAHATMKRLYVPTSKYPPAIEDLAIVTDSAVSTSDIISEIKKQSPLIKEVSLLDKFESTRTFHIIYQSYEKNLTGEEVGEIRTKILKSLNAKFNARLKE